MSARRKILVDADPSMLTWGFEVDDDLALIFLLGSPEIEVVGITTTFGNSLGSLTYRDAAKLLELCGRTEIPLAQGAGFFARDVRPTDASRMIVEIVRRHPGEVTLLMLGPLTNLRAAMAEWPELDRHLAGLVIMGGRWRDGLSDFNFRADPAAAVRVLAMETPKVVITIDLCLPVAVTPEFLSGRLDSEGSVIGSFVLKLRRFARWQAFFRAAQGRVPAQARNGFHPWDGIAAAWLVEPELFRDVREVTLAVDGRGRSTLISASRFNGRMPFVLDAQRFLDLFAERLRAPRSSPRN